MHRCRVVRSWPLTGVDEAGGEFGTTLVRVGSAPCACRAGFVAEAFERGLEQWGDDAR